MNPRKLVKKLVPKRLFDVAAPYGHLVEAIIYNCKYGFPARHMKVIGITGTNGKTTTSFLVHRMLNEAGYKTGLMTTVAWAVGDDVKLQTQHMTNVPVPLLMKRLKQMRDEGVEWLVLETTSHALAQYRTWGVPYSIAVLTNISQDHLDYHKTMERYIAAKQRLFKLAQRNKTGLQIGIANADDQNGASFAAETQNSIMYGIQAGDVRATNIKMDASGIRYDAVAPDETYRIVGNLPGSFNVYNTLAAVSVGRAVGLTKKQIEQGIAALPGVAGRMEPIDVGQPFAVVVDYAHTADALENVLKALRGSTKGKLAVVFGATGDRDKSKRAPMGEVVSHLADRVYLTDDETYTEDPDTIREAVLKGIVAAKGKDMTSVIADRLDAIRTAFKEAKPGDTILLAGIGHQDYRAMGGEKQPWDEREVARKLLKELKK
jgi:UDP-N-acetylmuramoyl-L-alanyl-D-glutamate--2,6-diaminopimelate ligase